MPKILEVLVDLRAAAVARPKAPKRRGRVVAGTDAVYPVKAEDLGGAQAGIQLSTENLPTGAIATFDDEKLGPGESTSLRVDTINIPHGVYGFRVNAIGATEGDYDWLLIDNADRLIDWTYCGIPGGIPNRTTIYASLGTPGQVPSYAQSVTAAQINAAIAACPADQVVYLYPGTYGTYSGAISLGSKSEVTLRGAGAGQTIINASGNAIVNTSDIGYGAALAISSGYTKGSTSITMASAPTEFTVGYLLNIFQNDDTSFIMASAGPGTFFSTTHRITNKDGNVLSFEPPLPYTLTAELNPKAKPVPYAGATLCGIEDMTLNSTTYANDIIDFWYADRCWAKGVEAHNATQSFIFTYGSVQCEVRRCYPHHAINSPNNTDGFGVYLYGASTYCLIEDNIFTEMFVGILQSSSSCNAGLYNYFQNLTANNLAWVLAGINCNHGAHGMMSLWEGNYGTQFQNDGYHGSGSHQTLFRNFFNGLSSTKTANRKCIDLCRASYYHNVIGNVLGDSSWSPTGYEMEGEQSTSNSYIYRLGYPNMGNNEYNAAVPWTPYSLTYPDAKVKATLLRHGNYDYFNNAAIWDGGIASHAIPDSLFYSSKPAYFGTLAWPPIGPDVSGLRNDIPAKARWDAYVISGNIADLF